MCCKTLMNSVSVLDWNENSSAYIWCFIAGISILLELQQGHYSLCETDDTTTVKIQLD